MKGRKLSCEPQLPSLPEGAAGPGAGGWGSEEEARRLQGGAGGGGELSPSSTGADKGCQLWAAGGDRACLCPPRHLLCAACCQLASAANSTWEQ